MRRPHPLALALPSSIAYALLVLTAGARLHAQGAPLDEGVRLLEARRLDEARAYFEALATREPRSAAAQFYLGRIAMEQNDPDRAAPFLERAVKLEDRSSSYHLWLGRAYGRQAQRANPFRQAGLARATKREFERAVQLDPENLEARQDVVEYYLQAPGIMGGSVEKARAEAAAIQQRNARLGHLTYARIAEKEKQPAEAQKHYEAALGAGTTRADSIGSLIRLSQFHQQQKQWDRSFAVLDSAAARMPDEMVIWYSIGRAGALSGQRLEGAEQALRRYLAHQPKRGEPPLANAHFRLGQVLVQRGDTAAARAEYRSAIALDPKLKDAQDALARLR